MENIAIENIKKNIENLIIRGFNNEAIELLEKLIEKNIKDVEVYSMYSVALNMIGEYKNAINSCLEGLNIEPYNFDLNYNLACIYESINEYSKALNYFNIALDECNDETLKENIKDIVNKEIYKGYNIQNKIVFFVKSGLDAFLPDIMNELSKEYIVRKVIVENYPDIDKWMEWADICWFEWCDELIVYGSNNELANKKKVICRLHRYEVFSDYIFKVDWVSVDKIIFVSEHIKERFLKYVKIEESKIEKVYNAVDSNKFLFKKREKGFNLACIGYLNLRKNPMMIIQMFNEIVKIDKRYKLFFAGNFQDEMLKEYIDTIVMQLGLKKNIIFDGYINNEDIEGWLSDKQYIISGSIAEGHPVGIMEAMMCGLKPCIHYFPGIEEMYPKEYVWKSYKDAINIIKEEKYDSDDYYNFIKNNYSTDIQFNKIKKIIKSLYNGEKKKSKEIIKGIRNIDIKEYISCEKFSSGYKLYLNNNDNVIDRLSYIVSECSGKKVIHLGCADHLELIDMKRKSDIWLHDKITYNSEECIGFDINIDAIRYINEELNIKNVFYSDIISERNKMICEKKWDIIIVGEILEHTNNPVEFLSKLKTLYSGIIDKILITVPNALKLENYILANSGCECINSDHKYWFTPYTIIKVMNEAGIKVDSLKMAQGYQVNDDEMSEILKKNNLLMDTIIIIGNI